MESQGWDSPVNASRWKAGNTRNKQSNKETEGTIRMHNIPKRQSSISLIRLKKVRIAAYIILALLDLTYFLVYYYRFFISLITILEQMAT